MSFEKRTLKAWYDKKQSKLTDFNDVKSVVEYYFPSIKNENSKDSFFCRKRKVSELKNKAKGEKMASIKDNAQNYEETVTKNVADLEKVSVELDLQERKFKEGTSEEFKINVICVGEDEYRVPNSVLKDLKEILAEKPDLKHFKVKKTGTGLQTKYTVIPLDE